MSYRLGVDVGGTFTDLLLINEKTGTKWTAKVPSTPEDSSIGVFNGINLVCKNAKIDQSKISSVMHGTTVATNTILTGTGSKVGLITTKGYRQVLQIARSFVPGGLGGWVIYNKSDTLLFGRESSGVPKNVHEIVNERLKIPMVKNKRSLNLASSVAIVLSEFIRQTKNP